MESVIEDLVVSSPKSKTLPDIDTILNSSYNTTLPLDLMHRISIAPMMDITNIHFRFFMRLLTKHTTLWTEMVHENAVINHKLGYEEFLKFNPVEHPIVIQFGGNSAEGLSKCAKYAEILGYDEININIGCPSPRVQEGSFGACLMKEPDLVAEACLAMKKATPLPVTIKTRLGVDAHDSYEFVKNFVETTHKKANLTHYIMHARKAYLKGLNPKENRNIPPLQYDRVIQLKKDFPHLEFTINGGFIDMEAIKDILKPENNIKGCMIGRAAHDNPWLLADVDRVFYGQKNLGYSRREIMEIWAEYGQKQFAEDPQLSVATLAKPIINLFAHEKNNTKFRQFLSDVHVFKNYDKNFKEFMHGCITHMEKFNQPALDERPPTEDKHTLEEKLTLDEKLSMEQPIISV